MGGDSSKEKRKQDVDPQKVWKHGKHSEHWFIIDNISNTEKISSAEQLQNEIIKLLPKKFENKICGVALDKLKDSERLDKNIQATVYSTDFESASEACDLLNSSLIGGNKVNTTCVPEDISKVASDPYIIKNQQRILDDIKQQGQNTDECYKNEQKIEAQQSEFQKMLLHHRKQKPERISGKKQVDEETYLDRETNPIESLMQQQLLEMRTSSQRTEEMLGRVSASAQMSRYAGSGEISEVKSSNQLKREPIGQRETARTSGGLQETRFSEVALRMGTKYQSRFPSETTEVGLMQQREELSAMLANRGASRQSNNANLIAPLYPAHSPPAYSEYSIPRVNEGVGYSTSEKDQDVRIPAQITRSVDHVRPVRSQVTSEYPVPRFAGGFSPIDKENKEEDIDTTIFSHMQCTITNAELQYLNTGKGKLECSKVTSRLNDNDFGYSANEMYRGSQYDQGFIKGQTTSNQNSRACSNELPTSAAVGYITREKYSESDLIDEESDEEEDVIEEPLLSLDTKNRIDTWLAGQRSNPSDTSSVTTTSSVKSDQTTSSVGSSSVKLQSKVWVSLLPHSVTGAKLRECFASQCEGVKGAYLNRQKKGSGAVIFRTVEQVKTCVVKMNRSQQFGQVIHVHPMRMKKKDQEGTKQKQQEQHLKGRKQRRQQQIVGAQDIEDSSATGVIAQDGDHSDTSSMKSGHTGSTSVSSRKLQAKVVVNALPEEVTGNQLRKCFASHCEGVKAAYILQSGKGRGEIVFGTREQMVACVKKMNKTVQFGQEIRVRSKKFKENNEIATSKEEQQQQHGRKPRQQKQDAVEGNSVGGFTAQNSDHSDNSSVITSNSVKSGHTASSVNSRSNKLHAMAVVNGLPYDLTDKKFRSIIAPLCEGVKRAYIHKTRKGCGEIVFGTPEQVEACVKKMHGKELLGQIICVRPRALTKENENDEILKQQHHVTVPSAVATPPAATTVVVSGLPVTMSLSQLSECFMSKCPGVCSVCIKAENNGEAEIVFLTPEQMKACVETMDQTKRFGGIISARPKESEIKQEEKRRKRRPRKRGRRRGHQEGTQDASTQNGSEGKSNQEMEEDVDDEDGSDSSLSLIDEPYLGTNKGTNVSSNITSVANATPGAVRKPPANVPKNQPDPKPTKPSAKTKTPTTQKRNQESHSAGGSKTPKQPVQKTKGKSPHKLTVKVENVPITISTSDFAFSVTRACKDIEIVNVTQAGRGRFTTELGNMEDCKKFCELVDGKTLDGQTLKAKWNN